MYRIIERYFICNCMVFFDVVLAFAAVHSTHHKAFMSIVMRNLTLRSTVVKHCIHSNCMVNTVVAWINLPLSTKFDLTLRFTVHGIL